MVKHKIKLMDETPFKERYCRIPPSVHRSKETPTRNVGLGNHKEIQKPLGQYSGASMKEGWQLKVLY